MKINKWQFFWRSFLLQGFWNFAQMQNVGVFFIVYPYLKQIHPNNDVIYKRALNRNLETFNSHPIMSGYSIGAMLKQEEVIEQTPKVKEDIHIVEREWRIIRVSTANTAASLGDRLFWATLKPLSLVASLFILFISQVPLFNEYVSIDFIFSLIIALLSAFIIYNVPAIFIRYKSFADSYEGSEDNFYGLIKLNWNKIITTLKTIGQVLTICIFIASVYFFIYNNPFGIYFIINISLLVAFMILTFVLKWLNIPSIYLYLSATVVFAIVSCMV